jgi:hypothetical protein
LREGLAAGFDEDHERLEQAVDEIDSHGVDVAREVRNLLAAVNAMALYAIWNETWPSYNDLKTLAANFELARPDLWFSGNQLQYFVTSLPKPRPASSVFFTRDTLAIGFAFGAWLLSDLPRPDDLGKWRFLDEIERALETGDGRLPQLQLV